MLRWDPVWITNLLWVSNLLHGDTNTTTPAYSAAEGIKKITVRRTHHFPSVSAAAQGLHNHRGLLGSPLGEHPAQGWALGTKGWVIHSLPLSFLQLCC